jgi:hypothetical protein
VKGRGANKGNKRREWARVCYITSIHILHL